MNIRKLRDAIKDYYVGYYTDARSNDPNTTEDNIEDCWRSLEWLRKIDTFEGAMGFLAVHKLTDTTTEELTFILNREDK